MADDITRIGDQLRRTLEGRSWHGPSVLEILEGISAAQASAHPIEGAHSIWELVLHITSDYTLLLRRLAGDGHPLTPGEDWPPCPEPTDENWQRTLASLRDLNQRLRSAVRAYPEARLDDAIVPEVPYTAYIQFIGVTQHNLYHAGQIALLKTMLSRK